MRVIRHHTFESLIRAFSADGTSTFVRRSPDEAELGATVKYPKYLFRGEPGVVPTTLTSLRRTQGLPSMCSIGNRGSIHRTAETPIIEDLRPALPDGRPRHQLDRLCAPRLMSVVEHAAAPNGGLSSDADLELCRVLKPQSAHPHLRCGWA
jgi:hypothetical protein